MQYSGMSLVGGICIPCCYMYSTKYVVCTTLQFVWYLCLYSVVPSIFVYVYSETCLYSIECVTILCCRCSVCVFYGIMRMLKVYEYLYMSKVCLLN